MGVTGTGLACGRAAMQKNSIKEVKEGQTTKEKFRSIAQAMASGKSKFGWN